MQRKARLSVGKTNVPGLTQAVLHHTTAKHAADVTVTSSPLFVPPKPRQRQSLPSPTKPRRSVAGRASGGADDSDDKSNNRGGSSAFMESKDDEEAMQRGLAHRQVSG